MKSTIIVVVLFLLPFPAVAGTFVETFDDQDLGEWQELIRNDAAPGSWEVVNRELQAISPDSWTRLLTIGDKRWRNYTIEVKVKPLEKHGPGNIVIAARIKETQLMFCEIGDQLFPGSNVICRSGNFHGNQTVLLHFEAHPLLTLNTWSTLKLSVMDRIFILWINDTKIVETGDDFILIHDDQKFKEKAGGIDNFLTGGAGFGLTNYTARFDNITITGEGIPDKGKLSVIPQAKLATTWGRLKIY